jgi:site-specific recombinase XerD
MQLSRAIHDFILDLRTEGKAKATITAYESDLMMLLGLAGVHGGNTVLSFTPELVRDYFRALSRRDLEMATLRRRKASISTFSKWGLHRRLWATDPVLDAPKFRKPKSLPRPYTREEHARLMALELPDEERVLRGLLYYAGLRISEALNLRLLDAVLGDDDRPGFVRVRGKGQKDRVVPMFPELRAILYDYFLARPTLQTSAFVIATHDQPWTRKVAGRRTHQWGAAARVDNCIPHRFRHTCATHLHEAGWDIRDIQEFLGHADITTTVIYTKVTSKRLADSMKRLGGLGVMSPGSVPPTMGAV